MAQNLLVSGPSTAPLTLVLAHGAGAPMDSPFMAEMAEGLAEHGWRILRFEFPYMQKRREDGKRRPPDRAPVLLDHFNAIVGDIGDPARVVIGGKSMGGRMASMIADEAGVAGLICLGYPFHPPGKPEKLRTAHLAGLKTPTLILQGERDTLGNKAEVSGYSLSPSIQVAWLEDGDHGFKPRKQSGRSETENLSEAVTLAHQFLAQIARAKNQRTYWLGYAEIGRAHV